MTKYLSGSHRSSADHVAVEDDRTRNDWMLRINLKLNWWLSVFFNWSIDWEIKHDGRDEKEDQRMAEKKQLNERIARQVRMGRGNWRSRIYPSVRIAPDD